MRSGSRFGQVSEAKGEDCEVLVTNSGAVPAALCDGPLCRQPHGIQRLGQTPDRLETQSRLIDEPRLIAHRDLRHRLHPRQVEKVSKQREVRTIGAHAFYQVRCSALYAFIIDISETFL